MLPKLIHGSLSWRAMNFDSVSGAGIYSNTTTTTTTTTTTQFKIQ